MDKPASASIYQLLRLFRHDLLNDLQLVLGHLQLEHSHERIYEETSKMVARIREVSSLFACQDDQLATLLWHWCVLAKASGVCLEYEVEPLNAPLDEAARTNLEQVVNQILSDLSRLKVEETFLHINIKDSERQFMLRCTPLQEESISQSLAASFGWHVEKTNVDWRYSYVH